MISYAAFLLARNKLPLIYLDPRHANRVVPRVFHLHPSIVEQSQRNIGTWIGQDVSPRSAFRIAEVPVLARVAAGSLSQADGEGEPVLGARYGGCGELDHDHLDWHWVEWCDLVLLCLFRMSQGRHISSH